MTESDNLTDCNMNLRNRKEIAALALYLTSDESAFTTGQTHAIDGGWSV